MTKLEEIRARVDNATPEPWVETDDGYVVAGDVYIHEPNNLGREVVAGELIPAEAMANVHLIAHAPQDIRYLLRLVEETQKALEEVLLPSDIRALLRRRELRRLRDALETKETP